MGIKGITEGIEPRPQHHFVHRFLGGEDDRNSEGFGEDQTSGDQNAVGQGQDRSGYSRGKKIGGDRNVADILTKYLPSPRLRSLLAEFPVTELEGRHSLAPQLQGKS